MGTVAQPLENLETGQTRHFQIEDDETGDSIRVRTLALQTCNRFGAVTSEKEWIGKAGFLGSHSKDQHIGLFVFCHQDRRMHDSPSSYLGVGAPGWAAGKRSCTQNRLPRPGSDSTPTLPPIRSTTFRTMARPMPVPSYALVSR